jgi:hypothetical protein
VVDEMRSQRAREDAAPISHLSRRIHERNQRFAQVIRLDVLDEFVDAKFVDAKFLKLLRLPSARGEISLKRLKARNLGARGTAVDAQRREVKTRFL